MCIRGRLLFVFLCVALIRLAPSGGDSESAASVKPPERNRKTISQQVGPGKIVPHPERETAASPVNFDARHKIKKKAKGPGNMLAKPMEVCIDPDAIPKSWSKAPSGLGRLRTEGRAEWVRRGGGVGSEEAVEAALAWLGKHQYRDGFWSFDHTKDACKGRCPDPGSAKTRTGATGLALLTFLGRGETPEKGKHKNRVKSGLDYLAKHQQKNGDCFEPGGDQHEHMYAHGICAAALCEAYAMTKDEELQKTAQKAIDFIAFAQDPKSGGWRYAPKSDSDTSAVGWQLMAMKSGGMANLKIDPQVPQKAIKFLDSVTADGAHYGYKNPDDRPKDGSTTAIALLCRMYSGWKKNNPGLVQGIQTLANKGPTSNDMYYNYYGTLVQRMYAGDTGKHWPRWNALMKGHLMKTQVKGKPNNHKHGSWMFQGALGDAQGGRLYNTAMAAMTLMVYYRYPLIYD